MPLPEDCDKVHASNIGNMFTAIVPTHSGGAPGFTLFTDSEVRHVRCDYVMHYSSVRKRRVRNTEKQGEGEIYVKLV